MNAKLQITGSARRVTAAAIEKAEQKHGYQVPEEYKSFLLKHNGGHPARCCFRFGKGAYQDSLIANFLSVGRSGGMDVSYVLEVFADRLPSGYFPIADDPGGNLILLSTAGRTAGAVYFWDHEQTGRKALARVAKSFADFLAMLTEEESDEEPDWQPMQVTYTDGSVEGVPSNCQLYSADRQGLVNLADLRVGETIEMFGLRRKIASIEPK